MVKDAKNFFFKVNLLLDIKKTWRLHEIYIRFFGFMAITDDEL
jgi:hypothetical protein